MCEIVALLQEGNLLLFFVLYFLHLSFEKVATRTAVLKKMKVRKDCIAEATRI